VAEERKAFLLRLPPELWKELEKWAADELRSVNGQIEYVLRQAVARRRADQRKSEE
jgi:hypothetical protein